MLLLMFVVVVRPQFAAAMEMTSKIEILFLCTLKFLSFPACLLGAGKLALNTVDSTWPQLFNSWIALSTG